MNCARCDIYVLGGYATLKHALQRRTPGSSASAHDECRYGRICRDGGAATNNMAVTTT